MRALVEAGFVVVANGGGGIPVVREDAGLRGVEAVIDKDLGAALLARSLDVDVLVVATDVPHAVLRFGTPMRSRSGGSTYDGCGSWPPRATSPAVPWAPRSRRVCRFVEQGGTRAVITTLDRIADAVAGGPAPSWSRPPTDTHVPTRDPSRPT